MNKHAIYCSDIEDEQMLKDWLKKEFSDTYYQRDYLFHNKLYFHFPALDNDLKDNFVIGYHTDENIRKDYTKINIKDFLKKYYKMNKTELLGLPIIKGEKHHLEAFAEDLKNLEYKISISPIKQYTGLKHSCYGSDVFLSNKDVFRDIYMGASLYCTEQSFPVKEFQLPQDWSKALDFMKENMDRWNKIQEENKKEEFKVGDVVVVTEQYKDNSAKPGLITKLTKISNSDNAPYEVECSWNYGNTTWCLNVRKATPQEIEEYNNKLKIFKMTSSSGDFELEVSKKGIYYRPEDNWLNTDNISIMLDCLRGNGRINHENIKGHYTWKVEAVTVGCKSNIPVESWKEVYDYYKSLQK